MFDLIPASRPKNRHRLQLPEGARPCSGLFDHSEWWSLPKRKVVIAMSIALYQLQTCEILQLFAWCDAQNLTMLYLKPKTVYPDCDRQFLFFRDEDLDLFTHIIDTCGRNERLEPTHDMRDCERVAQIDDLEVPR